MTRLSTRFNRRQFCAMAGAAAASSMAAAPRASIAQPGTVTKVGVFNLDNGDIGAALGAKSVRVTITAKTLANPATMTRLQGFHAAGIAVIATTWEAAGPGGRLPDPNSDQWNQELGKYSDFLRTAGPYIDYFSLANEPALQMKSDLQGDSSSRDRVLRFFSAKAERAQSIISADPKLSHVKVSSPAVFGLTNPREMTDTPQIDALLLQWANKDPHVDVVDIHEHAADADEIEKDIVRAKQLTSKPLIISEWSQAPCAYEWLDSVAAPEFLKRWNLTGVDTNSSFVKKCYEQPVGKEEWDDFVSRAPYDPGFMKKAIAVMDRHGIQVATYGQYRQYGSVRFDTKQLTASKTVLPGTDGEPQTNYKFQEWFKAATKGRP